MSGGTTQRKHYVVQSYLSLVTLSQGQFSVVMAFVHSNFAQCRKMRITFNPLQYREPESFAFFLSIERVNFSPRSFVEVLVQTYYFVAPTSYGLVGLEERLL